MAFKSISFNLFQIINYILMLSDVDNNPSVYYIINQGMYYDRLMCV